MAPSLRVDPLPNFVGGPSRKALRHYGFASDRRERSESAHRKDAPIAEQHRPRSLRREHSNPEFARVDFVRDTPTNEFLEFSPDRLVGGCQTHLKRHDPPRWHV